MSFASGLCCLLLASNLSFDGSAPVLSQPAPTALSTRHSGDEVALARSLCSRSYLESRSVFGIAQVDSRTQNSTSGPFDEAALRAIVERYFAAHGKKDL